MKLALPKQKQQIRKLGILVSYGKTVSKTITHLNMENRGHVNSAGAPGKVAEKSQNANMCWLSLLSGQGAGSRRAQRIQVCKERCTGIKSPKVGPSQGL